MPTLDQINNGDTIIFQSKATNDATNYRGQVVGFVKLDIAKGFGDVFTYNASVQSADPTVAAPDMLDFMLIKLLESVSVGYGREKYIMPFATSWINLPTLEIVAVDKAAIIRVYEVDAANVQNLIDYMRAGSYKVRVESLV